MKNNCTIIFLLWVCTTQVACRLTPEIGIRGSELPAGELYISRGEPRSRQQLDAAMLGAVPSAVRPIRQRQLEAAREQEVDLIFSDTGQVATTAIRGVPADIRDITITSEEQMAALVDRLYPLFGFSDTEQLLYQHKVSWEQSTSYIFKEIISGLPVEPTMIYVDVGGAQKVTGIRGTAVINQNFGIDHPLDAQSAIEAVHRHMEAEGPAPSARLNFGARAHLVYKSWNDNRTLAPWWYVEPVGPFYVDPDGVVSSAITITP